MNQLWIVTLFKQAEFVSSVVRITAMWKNISKLTLYTDNSQCIMKREINNSSQLISDNGLKWFEGLLAESLSTYGGRALANKRPGMGHYQHPWPMTRWQLQVPLRSLVSSCYKVAPGLSYGARSVERREIIFRAGRAENHKNIFH